MFDEVVFLKERGWVGFVESGGEREGGREGGRERESDECESERVRNTSHTYIPTSTNIPLEPNAQRCNTLYDPTPSKPNHT
jgi:hypothetical protein